MLERGPKELEFESDMFADVFNRYGSRLYEYVTCPCCQSEVTIDCGQPEHWFVIHVERQSEETQEQPFWLFWRDMYFRPELPLPFPNDIGKNSVHLMRFLKWEFHEGITLHEQHGRRFFIDYPDALGDDEWMGFRAAAAKHCVFYEWATREMIDYCLQVVSAVLGQDK